MATQTPQFTDTVDFLMSTCFDVDSPRNRCDSKAIFKLLEEICFDCDYLNRDCRINHCWDLLDEDELNNVVKRARASPGLVAKFSIPKNLHIDPKDKRNDGQRPGYARFTKWNESDEFIPLDDPTTDEASVAKEEDLKRKWIDSCTSPKSDDYTALTASLASSMSLDERSTSNVSGMCDGSVDQDDASVGQDDSSDDQDDASEVQKDAMDKDWLGSSADDELGDVTSSEEGEDEQDEGQCIVPIHDMVLLGTRTVGEEIFWILQNSWFSMPVIEMSTGYLTNSGTRVSYFIIQEAVLRDLP
jgi:hypothetical protein